MEVNFFFGKFISDLNERHGNQQRSDSDSVADSSARSPVVLGESANR
jgi:hypothetical protein